MSYFHSPIVTLGLDPILSKIVTQGYGPEYISVEISIVPGTIGRGPTRRKREEEERLIRIRVIDEDGKVMIQERLVAINELNKIKIKIDEGTYIHGEDIYIRITQKSIKEGEVQKIRVKAHEAPKG